MSTEVTLADYRIDPDKPILHSVPRGVGPIFTVSEVSKIFFARTAHWVRWRERKGFLMLDGRPVAQAKSPEGARRYNLHDVEEMTHALAQTGAISGAQAHKALLMVKIEAEIWELL